MKAPSGADVVRLAADPAGRVRLVLLYGPDQGLVHERGKAIVAAVAGDVGDPFRVAEFQAAAMKDEPSRLADEAASQALTGGRRAIWLRDATDANAGSAITAFLADPGLGDSVVVVEAGELTARSSLRKAAEAAPAALAVACYHDTSRDIGTVVRETLKESGLGVSADAIAYLTETLGNDRLISRAELEKLALYAAGKQTVELEDAQAAIGDSAAISVDDVIAAMAEGSHVKLERSLARAFADGETSVGLVRQALRHFQRLDLIAGMVAGGASVDGAIGRLIPPPFKRDADALARQARLWPTRRARAALQRLAKAEIDCKTTALPDQTLCARAFWEVTQLAANAGQRLRAS